MRHVRETRSPDFLHCEVYLLLVASVTNQHTLNSLKNPRNVPSHSSGGRKS